ncbi:MAG: CPBP family intramembrane metalloprotease [Balneolales bacterium]|nr:CPBP family intramembrane metalloprotease [Balneolales bacterium]
MSETNTVDSTGKLLFLSRVSGVAWVLIGSIIIYFHQQPVLFYLTGGEAIYLQLVTGILAGLCLGFAASYMMQLPFFSDIASGFEVVRLLQELPLSDRDNLEISLSAGFTEEWLFRVALIPLIGLWLASFLFIAVHGYIRFTSWAHSFFSIFMFVLSLALGVLFLYSGFWAAATAHAIYDFIVIRRIRSLHPAN